MAKSRNRKSFFSFVTPLQTNLVHNYGSSYNFQLDCITVLDCSLMNIIISFTETCLLLSYQHIYFQGVYPIFVVQKEQSKMLYI